jgi:hypothetical protein
VLVKSGEKGVVFITAELGTILHADALGQIPVGGLQPCADKILLDGKTGLRLKDPGQVPSVQIQRPCDIFHTERLHIVTADQILHFFCVGAALGFREEGAVQKKKS